MLKYLYPSSLNAESNCGVLSCLIRRSLKGRESIVYVLRLSMLSEEFYATFNQKAVRFDVPMLIQKAVRFESVIEYRVPPIHRCVMVRLGKVKM